MAKTRSPELEGLDEEERADAIERWVDSLDDEPNGDGEADDSDEEPDDEPAPLTIEERLNRARDLLGMARPATEEPEEAIDDEDR